MIYVIGYYDHGNIGDEQYKETINKVIKVDKFIDIDHIDKYTYNENDTIIVGGGDIFNDYFMKPIIRTFSGKKCILIALSIGIPFPNYLLYNNYIKIFDFIYVRSYNDYQVVSKYHNNCIYGTDLSYLLNNDNKGPKGPKGLKGTKKLCAVTLYNNDFINVPSIIKVLEDLNYDYIFIPFNYNENNLKENDYNYIKQYTDKVIYEPDYKKVYEIYLNVDLAICMRYHSCLFAYYNKVPFITLSNNQKIINFLRDINWSTYVPNDDDFSKNLKKMIIYLDNNREKLKKNMFTMNINMNSLNPIKDMQPTMKVQYKCKIEECIALIQSYLKENDQNTKEVIVKGISFILTGKYNSKYNYGLMEKLCTPSFNAYEEFKWILEDQGPVISLKSNDKGLFNITYKDQDDTTGVHRSGWKYVYDNIKQYHNQNGILLDLSIDETFHWNYELF